MSGRLAALRRRVLVLGLAASIAVAGCTGEGPTPAPTATPVPEATPTVTAYAIGVSVWYAGLVVTVTDATSTIDEKGGPVAFDLSLQNPTAGALSLDAPLVLRVGKTDYDPTRDSVIPEVEAGATATATVSFETKPGEDLSKAILRLGRIDDHVAQVPLVTGTIAPVRFQPRAITVSGSVRAGDLSLVLTGAELRWDLPDWGQELPRGSAVLTITYTATDVGTFAGGLALTADSVGLRLPNGTVLAPRRDGRSQSIVQLSPGAPQTGLFSRFEIPSGTSGTFALVVRDSGKSASIKVVVPA